MFRSWKTMSVKNLAYVLYHYLIKRPSSSPLTVFGRDPQICIQNVLVFERFHNSSHSSKVLTVFGRESGPQHPIPHITESMRCFFTQLFFILCQTYLQCLLHKVTFYSPLTKAHSSS
ncbi:hypothetical protein ATANTOWER_013443 [Ataeniobius toweri]|uniref:Uncharacterized protein n=1 Tax=Ataeniobius toweri TaxID=208326 RepID=A0ABU7A752_9TELE|nr:hypothetical protein [Ataeniobius toweri]